MFHRPPAAICAATIALFLTLPNSTRAAEDTVAVPRSEWEALKREMAEMHHELKELKAERAAARPMALAVPFESGNVLNAAPPQAPEHRGLKAPLEALSKSLTELITPGRPGSNAITISGEAEANWRWFDISGDSGFEAYFSPIFHWQMTDRLSFEAKIDLALSPYSGEYGISEGSSVGIDYAHLDWEVSDTFTLVLGKFRSPMNVFAERYYYTYINPLPDSPLGLVNGVLPASNVGLQLRGEFPLPYDGGAITTSAFLANAPIFSNPAYGAGHIDFPDVVYGRDNYAVGGRLGWQVCRNFELGYGLEYAHSQAQYSYDFIGAAPLLLQSLDLQTHLDAGRGRWTLQAQYGWSELDRDPLIAAGSNYRNIGAFSTHHHSGYVQFSYRGHEWESDLMNHLEFIARGDRLYYSGYQERDFTFDGDRTFKFQTNYPRTEVNRLTLGIDYWITDYTVLKAAYEYSAGNSFSGAESSIILGFATGL